MIKFLFKGIIKDRSRSLLPIIVVSLGVAFTVILFCWIKGIMGESIEMSANFNNGHLKVITKAYAQEANQFPNDLGLMEVEHQIKDLNKNYSQIEWIKRIRFGALIDFPDSTGETRAQGPVIGWGIDLFSKGSKEIKRFNLEEALVSGTLPATASDALISYDLAEKFQVALGDEFTLFGSSMNGSMAFKNFVVCGTIRFGVSAIDRGAIIIDVSDAQNAFAMNDAASEILGYFKNGKYNQNDAQLIADDFNKKQTNAQDEFAPIMFTLRGQNGMAELMDLANTMGSILIFVFVMAMSIVLWNAGLLGSLRRFNEFGVRLALGEDKKHIFKTLLYEGVLIGTLGTVIGTALGLGLSYLLQEKGMDVSGMMKNASIMIPSVIKSKITPTAFYIGFIPGLISMVLGNALAGIGIFKRKTATLFKELEV